MSSNDPSSSNKEQTDALLMPPPQLPLEPVVSNDGGKKSSFMNTLTSSFASFMSNLSSSKENDSVDVIIQKDTNTVQNEHSNSTYVEATSFPAASSSQRVHESTPRTGPGIRREKVALGPGYSPLDWAKLQNSGNLSGVLKLERFTPSHLALHSTREDCWIAFQGKVYNMTPYLKFHPGGVGQLMRAAGQDGTRLFMSIHPWVNIDRILEKCHVGYLIPERSNSHSLKP